MMAPFLAQLPKGLRKAVVLTNKVAEWTHTGDLAIDLGGVLALRIGVL